MLSKEERKWFKKNQKRLFDLSKRATIPDEVFMEIVEKYPQQTDEIRKDIRRLVGKSFEEGEDGNWTEYAIAAFRLMGIDARSGIKVKSKHEEK